MVERRIASFFDKAGLSPRGVTAGVALSGGADSVALLAAMRSLGWDCVALHCDFHLRGAESDRDAAHAERIAGELGCRFMSVDFDVEARRRVTGESVEMACRGLRYEWFERVAGETGLAFVAIAHHADDSEETFFLNALRGTGLKGLCGIAPRRGIFVRPMLDCSRAEVLEYLAGRGLGYVTDSSNLVADVGRNKIRLNILPRIREDFPSTSKGLSRTMGNLRSDYELFSLLLDRETARYVTDGDAISVTALLADFGRGLAENLLYRLMKKVAGCEGDAATAARIAASAAESGRYFDFGRRRFLLDRGRLVLTDAGSEAPVERIALDFRFLAEGEVRRIPLGGHTLEAEMMPAADFEKPAGNDVLWLDAGAVNEIMELRRPANSDRMSPFGLGGSVLLSKLMKDAKVPDNEKPRQWVLSAGDRILWLCGIRGSKHFPVTAASRLALRLRLI